MSDAPTPDRSGASAGADPDAGLDPATLASIVAGEIVVAGTRPMREGAVDSRRVVPGSIFFALPGERTDGHRFLAEAAAAGAAGIVLTTPPEADARAALGDLTIVRVDDAATALRSLAAAHRARFDPLVVGITGSIAKTSTKEQIAEVLDERYEVLRNVANENNEIGLPLTLLRLASRHDVAVLEMGLYTPGDIALLADIARPAIGVVTAVRGVHLSRAGSLDAIEAGKRELVEALPADGAAVLNLDDARVARMAAHTDARVVTYGFADEADVGAVDVRSAGEAGMRFGLRIGDARREVVTPVLGRHGVHNALAAAAVATVAGMDLDAIVRGLGRPVRAPHRSQLVRAGDRVILDDSYNASPDAVIAALDLLAELPPRRVAVLGEMLELGASADAEHERVGRHVPSRADRLIVVGDGAGGIADGAIAAGMAPADIVRVDDRDGALAVLLESGRAGDRILVKGSRGTALDVLVDRLVLAATTPDGQA